MFKLFFFPEKLVGVESYTLYFLIKIVSFSQTYWVNIKTGFEWRKSLNPNYIFANIT